VVLAGIAVGVFALLTALQHGNRADAVTTSTCVVPPGSTVAQIGVGSGTTTLAVDGGGRLTVNTTACTASSPPGSNSISNITGITMSVIPPVIPADVPAKVVLSETGPGGAIPCTFGSTPLKISGSLSYTDPTTLTTASTVPFEVDGAAGKNLTAGTKSSANGVDANGCGTPDVTVTGMGSYVLVAASNPTAVTLSAGGGTGFDGPTTTPTTLNGKAQGAAGVPDTFVAGDSSETFLTNTPGSTLDFSSAYPTCATSTPNPCSLTANSSSAASVATATGLAQYTASITGSAAASPSPTYTYGPNGDFTTLNGLGSGSTTFYPDVSPAAYQVNGNNVGVVGSTAGDYAVTIAGPGGSGAGTNDQVTAGATAETFTVTGSGLTVNGSSGDTTFTVAPPTGTTGGNTFAPGSGADNFYATGTANTVDFTNVLTSGSNAELTINRSGAPQGIGTGGSTVLPNGGAAVGSVPTYKFLNSATSSSASHFTTFRGAATGFTQFLAGPTGGLTFLGQGVANSNGASFLGNASGVVANLSGSTKITSANIGAGTTLSGFSLPDGQVLVAPPTGTSCPAASCDTITDLTNVTGPSFGYSTFYAGDAANGTSGNIYNFSDAGNNNTFYGGASTDVFGSTGNDNDYVAGSGSATFNESSQQSPNNTIDFSHVPVAFACATLSSPTPVQPCSLTVNVSGQQTAVPNYGAAMLDAQNNKIRTYGFATGGPNFTTFIGALGGFTTFQGGLGGYTYTGQGSGNTLDFSDVSSSVATTLSFDATTTPTQSATLANVPETFSGITTLVGLAAGNTVFTGGSTGGYTFKGNGSGNTAAFICTGAVINLSTTAVTSGNTPGGQAYVPGGGIGPCAPNSQSYDTLVDISNVNDARQGAGGTVTTGDTFVAGSGSEVFGDVFDALGDTIDFSNVNTGSGAPLTVNVSGAFASGVANDTATVGGAATYTFTTGGNDPLNKDFTTFVGPTRGFATFLAGDPAGHTFAAKGNSNSIDYSAATKGVTVDLSTSTGTVFEGSLPFDTITGLTTVTGSSAGGNKFTAGSGGPYNFTGNGNGNVFTGGSGLDTFSSNGNNNDFIAGSGSATFNDGGSANTLDFTSVGYSLVVNVSGVQVGTTGTDTALSGNNATYTFTTFGNAPTTIVGSNQGTTFFAGTATDTFIGQGLAGDTLSFAHTQSAGPLTINVVGANCASATYGRATVNSIQESFCGIKSFVGLPAGNNTFVADSTGGYTFNATGGNNTADFTAATSGINANLFTGIVTVGPGSCPGAACDTVSGVTSVLGASSGGNTFVAGTGSETFSDATGSKNAIDFSHLATGTGTALTVNVSGVTINGLSNDTASFNGATYNFQTGGSGFTTITGSSNGNTAFEGGSTPGYTLTGNGPINSVDFSTVTCGGVDVNLATTPGSVTFLGACPAGSDTVSGLTEAVGSSSGGNKFEAGAAVATYTFTGNGNGNTFVGDPDPSASNAIDVFSSTGTRNTFIAGSGAATFNDSTPGNTIDFSAVSAPLTVNVSGSQVGGTANDTATGGNPYTFSTFGAAQTTIKGSSGGTTFDAGTSSDTFIGDGPPGADQLSFANTSSNGPLTITPVEGCSLATNTLGQAALGSVTEKFCGIKAFTGLQAGNSTFVSDGTGGYSFTATGTHNTADYSAATSGINANLVTGNVAVTGACPGTGCDTVNGVTSILGSKVGGNTFVAGTSAETFGDTGTVGGDTIDFSNALSSTTAPLVVNASGSPVGVVNNDMASNGSTTYTFSNGGGNFTRFVGSSNGFTKFSAPASTGGYTFCATAGAGSACGTTSIPAGDAADFSANLSGITANLSPTTTPGGVAPNQIVLSGVTAPDTVGGMANVIGSPFGANSFFGGLTGTTFSSSGPSNAVSYVGLPALALAGAGVRADLTADHVRLLCPPASCSATGLPAQTDTFSFPSGSALSVQGSPGNDAFLVGTAPVTLSGGGGTDSLDLSAVPASTGTTGVTVNLVTGSVTGPAIGGVTFAPGCATPPTPQPAGSLCVSAVVGSHFDDTYTLPSSAPPLTLTGNGGNDTMDLSALTGSAAVAMPPIPSGSPTPTGTVTDPSTGTITFTGVPNVIGTGPGGDTFTAGQGTESFTENSNPGSVSGILDFSKVGTATAGVTVSVGQVGGVSSGSTTSAPAANVNDSFSNITTFIGTQGSDTFKQSGAGTYNFEGGPGSNVLDLSNAPSDENITINPPAPASACTSGVNANDGTAASQGTATHDTFTCMVDVIGAGTPVFQVYPNQPQAMLNGGGNGHVELMQSTAGATVNLGNGTVTSKDYNFKFTGMSTIDGTPFNDLFVPGTGNVTLNGGGGSDGVSFGGTPSGIPPAPAAVVANLSPSSYTVPTGFTAAGTSVPPTTAIGGYGGTIVMQGISNLIGTKQFNDVLVGGTKPGSLISGGSGNDRFVPSGGDTFVSGGAGAGTTLDLSTLPGFTTLDLGKSYPQNTGAGTVTVSPNSIHTVVASSGGSHLSAGTGNVTLVGGPGNDTLAGGNGTQTMIGGGGTDSLIAGVGNQTLQGGAQPVAFVPGGCFPNTPCTDTLTSAGSGNTLDYSAAPPTANCTNPGGPPCGVEVNLSSQLFPVPQNEPMGGTVLNSLSATGGNGATADLSKANITAVNGSPQADIVVTGTGGNTINGGGGDDLLVVSGGNNQLTAGANTNSRFLFEGAGNNVINGGGKATVDFSPSTVGGVTVNLQTGPAGAPTQNGTASGGFGGFQSLTGVLNAIGTNFNDVLVAGAPGGTMTGLNGGGDRLQSGPSGRDTLVSGGSASDEFCAESTCAVGGTVAGGANTMTGGFGNDTFYALNGAVDTIDGGGGFNSAHVDPNDIIVNNSIQSFIP
jgi:hypothetical protein